MFKAAFPFAEVEEENTEKEYIKSLDETSREEVAGNVWISPSRGMHACSGQPYYLSLHRA
jgi:hypothetical protein